LFGDVILTDLRHCRASFKKAKNILRHRFLNDFGISGCLVEKMAAGMPQRMAGDSRPFEPGLYQVCVHDGSPE
jgi:hypothetical protein